MNKFEKKTCHGNVGREHEKKRRMTRHIVDHAVEDVSAGGRMVEVDFRFMVLVDGYGKEIAILSNIPRHYPLPALSANLLIRFFATMRRS